MAPRQLYGPVTEDAHPFCQLRTGTPAKAIVNNIETQGYRTSKQSFQICTNQGQENSKSPFRFYHYGRNCSKTLFNFFWKTGSGTTEIGCWVSENVLTERAALQTNKRRTSAKNDVTCSKDYCSMLSQGVAGGRRNQNAEV